MTGIFQLADPDVHKLLSCRACGTCRGVCVCVCVNMCVGVCASNRGRGGGWFGWLARCELFVSRRREGGEPGVSLSCLLVWLLLVTLLDEIRGDRLSALHLSLSLSLSLYIWLSVCLFVCLCLYIYIYIYIYISLSLSLFSLSLPLCLGKTEVELKLEWGCEVCGCQRRTS